MKMNLEIAGCDDHGHICSGLCHGLGHGDGLPGGLAAGASQHEKVGARGLPHRADDGHPLVGGQVTELTVTTVNQKTPGQNISGQITVRWRKCGGHMAGGSLLVSGSFRASHDFNLNYKHLRGCCDHNAMLALSLSQAMVSSVLKGVTTGG